MYHSPAALGLVLRKVDIELEAFFDVEGQCSLAHSFLGLALALILGLALICSLQLHKVVVNVRLKESFALASSFDERFNMRLVT